MKRWLAAVAMVLVGWLVVDIFMLRPEGNAGTDKHAEELANKFGWRRYGSAKSLAKAMQADHLIGPVGVLEATDLEHEAGAYEDPSMRLQIVITGAEPGFLDFMGEPETIYACYVMVFDYYGPDKPPARIDCPDNARATIDAAEMPAPHLSGWIPSGGPAGALLPIPDDRDRFGRR